jgi:hypothetical protein
MPPVPKEILEDMPSLEAFTRLETRFPVSMEIGEGDMDVLEAIAFLNDTELEDVIKAAVADAVEAGRQDQAIATCVEARASFREKERART